ncbi:MAG TPA: DsbA family oxidoreductase [Candidatus Binataceae bacterium]|nr:DsbA family oxidoreductase [Candidatus Binataceae bacterium]
MALKLLMFSDFICPFCYIGFEVVRKLKPEFDLEIEWRGFQIHPEWPAEGMPASAFRSMDAETRRIVWERIQSLAQEAGFWMKPPELLMNSRLALEAAEFAKEAGAGEPFEERVYRAYFQEGRNIGDSGVLGELATDVGLSHDELRHALEANKYSMRLKNTALTATQRGVSGVPTFFVGQFPMVGAQSETVMRQLLSRAVERLDRIQAPD